MKILITGGSGLVGSRFVENFGDNFQIDAPSSEQLNILDPFKIEQFVQDSKPEVLINFAAFTDVEGAEDEADNEGGLVYRLNSLAPANLAKVCKNNGIHLLHISTDYVFDGEKDGFYNEEDETKAINWYGETKLLGEQFVMDSGCDFTIVRTEMPYRAKYEGKVDFARFFLNALKKGEQIKAISDQKITPVFVDSLVKALAKIVEKKPQGIYHAVSTDATSPYEFVMNLAEQMGLDKSLIQEVSFEEFYKNKKAKRPKNSCLAVAKFENEFGKDILLSNQESIRQLKNSLEVV